MSYTTRLLLVILALSSMAAVSGAYVTQIHASAVLEGQDQGLLTLISLNATPGNGSVRFIGQADVNESTLASAQAAVQYAATYLSVNSMRYNFTFEIENATGDISGPSGGLAFTLLAISGIDHRPIAQDFSVTGTIEPSGGVGLIGGIYDKIWAAKKGEMDYMIVPAASNSTMEALLYYISQQDFDMPVVEVANVSQAVPYAFGGAAAPGRMGINLTQGYDIGGVASPNITCTGCNASVFGTVTESTLNFTGSYIDGISGNFSTARDQLLGNLEAYDELQDDGYLYTAADLAFLDFPKAFLLYNAAHIDKSGAEAIESSVSSYCSSLTPPQLTDTNYEYIAGGSIRHYWAEITLNASQQLINSSESSDDLAQSIYDSAEALGWCKATGLQYQIASSLGGNNVSVSQSFGAYVGSLVKGSSGTTLYSQSEAKAYAAGDYVTALYAAEYQKAFGVQIPNLNYSQLVAAADSNIMNSTAGAWPSEFALHAEFYLNEANATANAGSKNGYADQAYSTSVLASGLEAANARIAGSLVASNGTQPGASAQAYISLQQQVASMQQQMNYMQEEFSTVYSVLIIVLVLILALLLAILFFINRPKPRRRSRRAR